jgi:hypothetical protein
MLLIYLYGDIMLMKIIDALGVQQTIIAPSQESSLDHSGSIAATGVSQLLLAANVFRSGWFIQNKGANPMYLNDLGVASVGAGSFVVAPGNSFPPPNYPMVTGAINILGSIGDTFVVREW